MHYEAQNESGKARKSRTQQRTEIMAAWQRIMRALQGNDQSGEFTLEIADAEWVRFMLLAGYAGVLQFAIDQQVLKVRGALAVEIEATALAGRVVSSAQIEAADHLLGEAEKRGIELIPLKGLAVGPTVWPKPHIRSMRDIDVLCAPGDVPALEEYLHAEGFEPRSDLADDFYLTHHHAMPLYHPTRRVWVELHTGLMPRGAPEQGKLPFTSVGTFGGLQPGKVLGHNCWRLDPAVELAYIIAHWALELRMRGGVFALIDVMLLLGRSNPPIDQAAFTQIVAGQPSLIGPVRLVAHLLQALGVNAQSEWLFESLLPVKNRALGVHTAAALYTRHFMRGREVNATGTHVHLMRDAVETLIRPGGFTPRLNTLLRYGVGFKTGLLGSKVRNFYDAQA